MSVQNVTKPQETFGIPAGAEGRPVVLAISTAAVVVIAAYIGAQMLADFASLKIGIVFALAVDMGTFIYPITFTLRDVAHKPSARKIHRR